MRQIVLAVFSVVFTFAISERLDAAPIFFTNKANFNTAAAGAGVILSTQTFNGLGTQNLPAIIPPMTITQVNFNNGFTPAVTPIVFANDGSGPGQQSVQVSTGTNAALTFTFSSPINAFGVDIFDLGSVGPTTLSMSVDGGAPTNLFTNFSGGSGNQLFGGVVDSTPFTSVTIRNSASGDFIEFDNVRFGAAVPEPTSLSLFALVGAVGLAYARKRRKAAQGA